MNGSANTTNNNLFDVTDWMGELSKVCLCILSKARKSAGAENGSMKSLFYSTLGCFQPVKASASAGFSYKFHFFSPVTAIFARNPCSNNHTVSVVLGATKVQSEACCQQKENGLFTLCLLATQTARQHHWCQLKRPGEGQRLWESRREERIENRAVEGGSVTVMRERGEERWGQQLTRGGKSGSEGGLAVRGTAVKPSGRTVEFDPTNINNSAQSVCDQLNKNPHMCQKKLKEESRAFSVISRRKQI